MLTSDLTVVDNQGSVTLPGGAGSLTFALVAGGGGTSSLRRVAATANTTPQELRISHTEVGKGFARRLRSLIQARITKNDAVLTSTGGIVPSISVSLTIDRPMNMGVYVTDQNVKDLLGQVFDVVTRSGQLAKLFNQES
jgi:hypothetical protein